MSTEKENGMRRVVVTGLGFITSIGNNRAQVLASLRETRTGMEYYSELERPGVPVRLAGTVKEFEFPELRSDEWIYPEAYKIRREHLRSMSPNAVYGFCAMEQAIADAQLPPELVSNPRTGAMCASNGSAWLTYEYLKIMLEKGPQRAQPDGDGGGDRRHLEHEFCRRFRIKGHSLGFSSACASSAHALGAAFDRIRANRQDIVFVAGAEDCNLFSILPFVGMRALTTQTDPALSPCAFDRKRDGFVVTGGATVLVLEELEHARRRGAPIHAEMLGWGEASDGYTVMAPEPKGDGLARAMEAAIERVRPDRGGGRLHQRARHFDAGGRRGGDSRDQARLRREIALRQQHEISHRPRPLVSRRDGSGLLLSRAGGRLHSRLRQHHGTRSRV